MWKWNRNIKQVLKRRKWDYLWKNIIIKIKKKGGILLSDTKKLTQIEIDNKLDETINLSIISKLLNLKLITEKQYYILKEKIKNFY